MDKFSAIGVASCIGAASPGCSEGPRVCQKSSHLNDININGKPVLTWVEMLEPVNKANKEATIADLNERLAHITRRLVKEHQKFLVFSGDHSSAIGVWSGAAVAQPDEGALGLLWIDAHLDAHTPQTSESGNIHGMPVASLLGHGYPALVNILNKSPKIKPENLCYIGVRSYEAGEKALIERLGVKVYYMDEVKEKGLRQVLVESLQKITQHTTGFGISLDIDVLEPSDAPGTGINVPDGISGVDLCAGLRLFQAHPKLVGMEIAEFDPSRDQGKKTEKLIGELVSCLTKPKEQHS